MDVKHIKPERWGPLLVDADWYAFCQALCEGVEGKDWEPMYDCYQIMSKAAGVKKPQKDQKARALWAMKAAKDRREEFCDPACGERTLWEEIKRDWSCGKSTSMTQLWSWTMPQKFVEDQY